MRVMVLYNPISGAGRGRAAVDALVPVLEQAGHDVVRKETRPSDARAWLTPALGGIDALIVAGGDGTIRGAAIGAAGTDVPLFHLPCGTENLFARAMHMTRDPAAVVAALNQNSTAPVDMGVINGERFLLMASIGLDAEVVADLAAHRGASITHATYLGPMLRAMSSYAAPVLNVRVDGEMLVDGRAGWAVIANCSKYARNLDPARGALHDDGLLDVVFLPISSRWAIASWLLRLVRGTHLNHPASVQGRGEVIEIDADPPARWQIDGDVPSNGPDRVASWRATVEPGVIRVLQAVS